MAQTRTTEAAGEAAGTVRGASELLRRGELTAAELLATVLERVADTEERYAAYAYLDAEGARAEAERADGELQRGRWRGPLHGIPVGVKDLLLTADLPTAAGTGTGVPWAAATDAEIVRRLRRAGAVLLGKHRTHEFGLGLDVPPTRNAWDPTRYPGGSSAGGAVSVALGSSLAAIGTDAAGSVRKPASLNGLVGLKPTFGLLPTDGIVPGATSLDHIGLITRTCADAALMLEVLTGGWEPPQPADSGPDGTSLRIGTAPYFGERVALDVAAVLDSALARLAAAGARMVAVDIPELRLAWSVASLISAHEAYRLHRGLLATRAADYHPACRHALTAGGVLPSSLVAAAYGARRVVREAVRRAFTEHRLDLLVTPTLPLTAIRLDRMSPRRDLPEYCRFTVPANVTGQPALSVPGGLSAEGLPVGVQLVGRPFADRALLGAGALLGDATPLPDPAVGRP